MKADTHLHSEFSDDSVEPMEFQIDRAVELGFDEICFTEHVDYGQKHDWGDPALKAKWNIMFTPEQSRAIHYQSNVNYDEYFMKLARMQKNYEGIIKIDQGLELGVQSHRIDQYNKLVEKYNDKLDFCLLSMHQVDDKALWSNELMEGRKQEEYVMQYYEEILKVSEMFDNYDSVAHLDLIVRYDPAGAYPFEKTKNVISEIFKVIIKKNKCLEFNTSCYKYKTGEICPAKEIWRLYKDLGGEMITIGSDAHSKEYVGDHLDFARQTLKDFGFKHFFTYDKHQAIAHNL